MVDENNDPRCSQWINTCSKPIPKEYWYYPEYDGTAVENMKTAVIRKGYQQQFSTNVFVLFRRSNPPPCARLFQFLQQ